MKRWLSGFTVLAILSTASSARADSFHLYGDSTVVAPGPAGSGEPAVFQHSALASGLGYGGEYLSYTGPLYPTLDQLFNLSADYEMTIGTFDGGSPRFSLVDSLGHEAWIYWGTPLGGGTFADPHAGVWANTGNYASLSSLDVRVYSNGFGGVNSPNTGMTFAQLVDLAGSTAIKFVFLDLDASFILPGQRILVDNFTVNDEVYDAQAAVPEPLSLTLLGTGLVGLVWKRRRTTAA